MTYTMKDFPWPIVSKDIDEAVQLPNKLVLEIADYCLGLYVTVLRDKCKDYYDVPDYNLDYREHPLYDKISVMSQNRLGWLGRFCKEIIDTKYFILGKNRPYGEKMTIKILTKVYHSNQIEKDFFMPQKYMMPNVNASTYIRQNRNWVRKNYDGHMVFVYGVPSWVTKSKQLEMVG